MPGQRLPMRKIRDVLRLSAGGMSKRKIAISLSVGATAAGDCIRRARAAWLGVAAAGRPGRRGAGGAAVPCVGGAGGDQGAAVTAGLASDSSRAPAEGRDAATALGLSLIHISEPTRRTPLSYAVFC